MYIIHSHAIDNQKYAVAISNAQFSISLAAGLSVEFTGVDIKHFQRNGLNLSIDIDEWFEVVRLNVERIRSYNLMNEVRKTIERNNDKYFFYEHDYGEYWSLISSEEVADAIKNIKANLLPNYVKMIENIKTEPYLFSPSVLENISNVNSKWSFNNDNIEYKDSFLNVQFSPELKTELFSYIEDYFEKYYESTISAMKNNAQKQPLSLTLDTVFVDWFNIINDFCRNDNSTVEDFKNLLLKFSKNSKLEDGFFE